MFVVSFIPAFKDNYIWLLTEGKRAFVVDPGDAAPVVARLLTDGLSLEGILITHHHADHQGGVADLVARWPARVYAPATESITGCTHPLSGGERIEVLGQSVRVIAVPGHTRGHICFHLPEEKLLFAADTLFDYFSRHIIVVKGRTKSAIFVTKDHRKHIYFATFSLFDFFCQFSSLRVPYRQPQFAFGFVNQT